MLVCELEDTEKPVPIHPHRLHVLDQIVLSSAAVPPRPLLNKHRVPLASIQKWQHDYQHDDQFPCDLQLERPRSRFVADIMLGVRPTSGLKHAHHGQLKGVARAANFALFPPDENTCSQPGSSSLMSEQPSPAMQRMEQQVPLEQQSGVTSEAVERSPFRTWGA